MSGNQTSNENMLMDVCPDEIHNEEIEMEAEDGELEDSDNESTSNRRRGKFAFDVSSKGGAERSSFAIDDLQSMEKRAIRFGLDKSDDESTLEKELQKLHLTLGIVTDEDARHAEFDTIHIRGTQKMTTDDVFQYFFAHGPLFLEWIDENSCNIVWKDNISAARAMVFYSKPIKTDCSDSTEEELADEVSPASLPMPLPPGRWRVGAPHPRSECLLFRFGNKSDKKLTEDEKLKLYSKKYNETIDSVPFHGIVSKTMKSKLKAVDENGTESRPKPKNPWGDLCRSWGINDSQELYVPKDIPPRPHSDDDGAPRKSVIWRIGAPNRSDDEESSSTPAITSDLRMRLGKRPFREPSPSPSKEESSEDDEEWKTKSKVPRMRMHADDEEQKTTKHKLPTKFTSDEDSGEEIVIDMKTTRDVRERLGNERRPSKNTNVLTVHSRLGTRRQSSESKSDDSDSDSSYKNSNRPKHTVSSTIWCRLGVPKNSLRSDFESNDYNSDGDNQTDLRHALKKNKSNKGTVKSEDLRGRLGKKKQFQRSPLRIEIDNELYSDS